MIKLLYIIKLIFVINLFLTSNLYANESNDTVSIEKQSYAEIVEILPYEYISFESSKKFIKSLKDILKDEMSNDKLNLVLKSFDVPDKGKKYKNIKKFRKALPLGSSEIIRTVKELKIVLFKDQAHLGLVLEYFLLRIYQLILLALDQMDNT